MAQGHEAIPNLLGMARTAVEAGNSEEAISYFNRVLEIDPTVSEAWLGKGYAVARQSSLANVRMREVAVSFGHAIATTPKEEQPDVAHLAITELTTIGLNTSVQMLEHAAQFAGVQGTAELRASVFLAILDAMEVGMRWMPDFEPGLRLIVSAGNDALAGSLLPSQVAEVQTKIAGARQALRVINPEAAAAEDAEYERTLAVARERAAFVESQKRADSNATYFGFAFAAIAVILLLVFKH